MVTQIDKETLTQAEYDSNARAYFLAMLAGRKPDERPDVGKFWTEITDILEGRYEKAASKPGITPEGIAAAMVRVFETIGKEKPALPDLLRDTTAKAEQVTALGIPTLLTSAQLPPKLSNGACPWLDWYVDYSRQASDKAFDGFHAFVGLWLLSTIAARRVYLQIKRKWFYTNLMIALFAETSFYAKSFTVGVAKEILYELELDHLLGPDRVTPQKLWSDMSGVNVPAHFDELPPAQQIRIRQERAMSGQVGLVYDEFGKFVQGMLRKQSTNVEFIDMFLTFDGCPPRYRNATISRDGEPITNPYIALIGNVTPPNLKDNARAGADFWQDGFWARFSFVVAPPAKEEDIKDDEDDDDMLPIPARILEALKDWHTRLGIPDCHIDPIRKDDKETGRYSIEREELPQTACTITREAKQAWKRYAAALERMSLKFPHRDFIGSYKRLPETAMRMAVLMASLSNNNKVDIYQWAKAQELAELLRYYLHALYTQVNSAEDTPTKSATLEAKIRQALKTKGPLTIPRLRSDHLRSYGTEDIFKAVRLMLQAREVRQIETSRGFKYEYIEPDES